LNCLDVAAVCTFSSLSKEAMHNHRN
jgi:hypothetical protein